MAIHFRVSNNSWGMFSDEHIDSGALISFAMVCVGSPVIIMLQKSKQTSIRKIKDDTVGKQGRSPTPADIFVYI